MMVEFLRMKDNLIQQRRGRADGTVAAVADRSAVAEDRALAPQTTPASQGWPPMDRQPPGVGRDFVDSAERCSLARPAREIPPSFNVLAAVARWEEQGVWLKIWRTFLSELNERQQLQWSESFLDGSFAPAKKGALESGKPSGAKGRSGWWWSTAAVFLWETTFTLHPRRKSGSRKRRSRRSA